MTGDLAEAPRLEEALWGADIVVHTAARAHVIKEHAADPLAAFRAINVTGTMNLARAAAAAGVPRFVYLSSIGVNGKSTPIDRPFTEADPPAPKDAYGLSKLEAERALWALCETSGLQAVMLRPPLVYGPGAKGNLLRLMQLVALGVPLPFGAIRNKRSMIGLGNLVTAIIAVLDHPAAIGNTFLVSDQNDISTPELLRALGDRMRRPMRLWPAPVGLLHAAGSLAGRRPEAERLTGSLRIDADPISRALGWRPTVPLEDGLRQMVETFNTR